MDYNNSFLIMSLSVFALSVVTVIALGLMYKYLKGDTQNYLYEEDIEEALLPFIYQAIGAAYKASEKAIDEIQVRMDGVNKKKIADSIYDLLPPKVGMFPVSLVKLIVTKAQFGNMVQLAYDKMDDLVDENQEHFDKLYREWIAE